MEAGSPKMLTEQVSRQSVCQMTLGMSLKIGQIMKTALTVRIT